MAVYRIGHFRVRVRVVTQRREGSFTEEARTAGDREGDYDPVADPTDPDGPLTAKAFGAAIQLNRGTNQPGTTPEQPKALIAAMARWGFGWAGRDAYPQGALFRYRALSVARD